MTYGFLEDAGGGEIPPIGQVILDEAHVDVSPALAAALRALTSRRPPIYVLVTTAEGEVPPLRQSPGI